ncbi:hypothetical protein AVDCRST_MAG82-1944 [uncultured Rubrobacteraceae bacterium]|uniref:Uncharacterized protein n=1 Tax=uncultured Rubrobacteraceae bacterium TaxID=349277 RepID=A0A6J4Q2T0_9ACTN|nr:hypothetical protein AVDCRST_MAG82-1944 [uncultured Rubrobacteraceae bacterium]
MISGGHLNGPGHTAEKNSTQTMPNRPDETAVYVVCHNFS